MSRNNPIEYNLHPLREELYNELHIRPFYPLASPQQVTHLAACCSNREELLQSYELLCQLCRRYDVNIPKQESVNYHENFGDFTVHWERHAEFYSFTVMHPVEAGEEPFNYTAIDLLPRDWISKLPGQVLTAFHVIIDTGQLSYEPTNLSRYFEGHQVVASNVFGGKAQIYTAFKLHGDHHGRFIIRHDNLGSSQLGQLHRRLTDLETYRMLTLVALPVAKRIAPQLLDMDRQLAQILSVVTDLDTGESERDLLETISSIEAHLESYRTETNHRFSATRAYYQLVNDRLEGLKEEHLEGFLSMGEFINRRLTPAIRTCESVKDWMEDLSRRIERASDLMRTRVNLILQEQNRSQLAAMNRRSKLQFRLQETVEGLSIAAISYYAVGLLGYLFSGLPLKRWGVDKNTLLAAAIPCVVVVIWFVTRRIKRKLLKDEPCESGH